MPFSYCLNTSTIRSDGATILDMIDTTADAGYDGIEPWVAELDAWVDGGGTLAQVKARADERGLSIVNLIGFPEWAVPEDDRRAKGFEEAARCFQIARDLGCPCVAAPPFGIHDRNVDLLPVTERFAELVDLAAAGKVKSHIGRVAKLSELPQVFDDLEAARYVGRAVITDLGS